MWQAGTKAFAYSAHREAVACFEQALQALQHLPEDHDRQAHALVRTRKERGHEAWTLRLLGEIAAPRESPDAEQAETHYRQVLALAETLGMRPLQTHCYHGLGILYTKTGQQEQARTALFTALGLYRSTEMTFWLPQVEAALGADAESGRMAGTTHNPTATRR